MTALLRFDDMWGNARGFVYKRSFARFMIIPGLKKLLVKALGQNALYFNTVLRQPGCYRLCGRRIYRRALSTDTASLDVWIGRNGCFSCFLRFHTVYIAETYGEIRCCAVCRAGWICNRYAAYRCSTDFAFDIFPTMRACFFAYTPIEKGARRESEQLIGRLKKTPSFMENVTHWETVPAKEASSRLFRLNWTTVCRLCLLKGACINYIAINAKRLIWLQQARIYA